MKWKKKKNVRGYYRNVYRCVLKNKIWVKKSDVVFENSLFCWELFCFKYGVKVFGWFLLYKSMLFCFVCKVDLKGWFRDNFCCFDRWIINIILIFGFEFFWKRF